jgi:hypothetical protein
VPPYSFAHALPGPDIASHPLRHLGLSLTYSMACLNRRRRPVIVPLTALQGIRQASRRESSGFTSLIWLWLEHSYDRAYPGQLMHTQHDYLLEAPYINTLLSQKTQAGRPVLQIMHAILGILAQPMSDGQIGQGMGVTSIDQVTCIRALGFLGVRSGSADARGLQEAARSSAPADPPREDLFLGSVQLGRHDVVSATLAGRRPHLLSYPAHLCGALPLRHCRHRRFHRHGDRGKWAEPYFVLPYLVVCPRRAAHARAAAYTIKGDDACANRDRRHDTDKARKGIGQGRIICVMMPA